MEKNGSTRRILAPKAKAKSSAATAPKEKEDVQEASTLSDVWNLLDGGQQEEEEADAPGGDPEDGQDFDPEARMDADMDPVIDGPEEGDRSDRSPFEAPDQRSRSPRRRDPRDVDDRRNRRNVDDPIRPASSAKAPVATQRSARRSDPIEDDRPRRGIWETDEAPLVGEVDDDLGPHAVEESSSRDAKKSGDAKEEADDEESRRVAEFVDWVKQLDGGQGALLEYIDVLKAEFDADFRQICAVRLGGAGFGEDPVESIDPCFWEVCGVENEEHQSLFAKGIVALEL